MKWAINPEGTTVWYKSFYPDNQLWIKLKKPYQPCWDITTEYYIGETSPSEPVYIEINGHKIKKPLTSFSHCQDKYYIVTLISDDLCFQLSYRRNPTLTNHYIEKGICHATKEDAIAHAKALLSFTAP
jgi:hypothetical protein